MTATKHIHCDVIKAWADGETIQMKVNDPEIWKDVTNPSWSVYCQYRVKPKPVTKWYRVALFKWNDGTDSFSIVSNQESMEEFYSNHKNFVRWVTDRQYVEVE